MARYGERQEPKAANARYDGFTRDGRYFTSETPVMNATTDFVKRTIRKVRDRRLAPADLVLELLTEGDEVQALFATVAGQWSQLAAYSDWPVAFTSCSVHEAIKRNGGAAPPLRA